VVALAKQNSEHNRKKHKGAPWVGANTKKRRHKKCVDAKMRLSLFGKRDLWGRPYWLKMLGTYTRNQSEDFA
jgi:hypothetical protein